MEKDGEFGEEISIKQLRRAPQVKTMYLEVERTLRRFSMERKPVPTTVEVQATGSLNEVKVASGKLWLLSSPVSNAMEQGPLGPRGPALPTGKKFP